MKTLTKEMQNAITPSIALDLLQRGNQRFLDNLKINRNLQQQAIETSNGQHPFAVILSCIDSRTSVELIFDQGLGDVFSIRIAGAIVNDDILGSMEFCCSVAGAKAIVVLGHTKCGAVKGACDHSEKKEHANNIGKKEQACHSNNEHNDDIANQEELVITKSKNEGIPETKNINLINLLEKFQSSIDDEKSVTENRTSSNDEFVEKVTSINVRKTVQEVMEKSPVLKQMIEKGQCGIIGGKHDISTGEVSFYHDTMLGFFKHKTETTDQSKNTSALKSKL